VSENKRFSYEEPMQADEFIRLADAPLSQEALDDMVEYIRWFRRRYPTVKERFAYATRKTRALRATSGRAG
jgi:hypothetical protein